METPITDIVATPERYAIVNRELKCRTHYRCARVLLRNTATDYQDIIDIRTKHNTPELLQNFARLIYTKLLVNLDWEPPVGTAITIRTLLAATLHFPHCNICQLPVGAWCYNLRRI